MIGGKSSKASTATAGFHAGDKQHPSQLQGAYVNINSEAFKQTGTSNPQIYLIHGSKDSLLLHTLDKEQRNSVVRQNPIAIVTACQNAAFREVVNRHGAYRGDEVVALWRPSFLPFHLEYTVVRDGMTCQHLVSARDRRVKEPVSTQTMTEFQ